LDKIDDINDLIGSAIKSIYNSHNSVTIKTDKGEITIFSNAIGMLFVKETKNGSVQRPETKIL